MKSDNVAIILQKTLQEVFDAECRSYANYLKIYEMLFKACEKLEKKVDELEEEKELIGKMKKLVQIFHSKEFDKISKSLNLSDSDVKKFVKAISMYKEDPSLESKLQDAEYEIDAQDNLLKMIRDNLHVIENNVKRIIDYVKDAEVELEFLEENPIAERLLVLVYCDGYAFENYRKVIKMEDCKFSDNFVKAYLAIEGEEKAYSWFVEEARKYKI